MKKNYISFLFLFSMLFALQTNAQSLRKVFLEEATQASCPPCAALNPALMAKVNANPDKVIFMAYQVWWPGFDPMYEDNPGEVDVRVGDYYDYTFAPQLKVQGSFVGDGALGAFNQTHIDAIAGDTSEFDITLNAEIINGELKVTGSVDATTDVTGNLRLRMAIIEHVIHKADAPGGTTSEDEYHNVFKKFIGGTNGITLADTWASGDSYTIDQSFDLGTLNIYNYSEVQVIAFVQNDANKFIHQAAIAEDVPITVEFDNNAGAIAVSGLPGVLCSGTQSISPVFTLQNTGNVDLTSATIVYNVNGGANESYDWTGTLTTLAKEEITLPAISFDVQSSNVVNVEVTNPNGSMDESIDDNQATSGEILLAPASESFVVVQLKTDGYGDETYWEIRDGAGEIVKWGGNPNVGLTNIGTGTFPPPSSPSSYGNQTTYTDTVNILSLDCFTFHITDYYGDGMSDPASANGYYRVKDNLGNTMIQGGGAFIERLSDYEGTGVNSAKELTAVTSLNFFPNPAADQVTISFELAEVLDNAVIEVTNVVGQKVMVKNLGTLNIGAQQIPLNVAQLNNGLYMVTMTNGDKVITRKLQVQK